MPLSHNETLGEHVHTVVRQFDYSDADVNKGVKEFLRQMRTCCNPQSLRLLILTNILKTKVWRRMARASAKFRHT
jgi:predicted oxidoreductase (fatty acid repression mutant protein)